MPNPPLPTNVKELRGTIVPHRINKDEPKYPKKVKAPTGMTAAERKRFYRHAKLLADAGVMTEMDVDALEAYCKVHAKWKHALRKVDELGMVVKGSKSPILNPYYRAANSYFDQMKTLMVEFGMTPSSRTRVKGNGAAGGEVPEDPWADFGEQKVS